MIKLKDILNEGVYDPGIFKAIFTAGGPGSGKTFAASTLFGMPEKVPTVSAGGLKGVNTDKALETLLKKAGLGTDIQKMGPDKYAQAMELRKKAKRTIGQAMKNYINGKLGMIIDGTGHNASKIAIKKKGLEKLGYDCFMVFVNTSLKVALERNANRERILPVDVVKNYWNDCQQNLGKFQSMFGASNMLIVDNSKYQDFPKEVKKAANKFVSKPIQNPSAKAWIKKELELKSIREVCDASMTPGVKGYAAYLEPSVWEKYKKRLSAIIEKTTGYLMAEASSIGGRTAGGTYKADEGEPDTGFIHGGKKRKLGKLAGKPEDWFDNGGYTQLHFPEADYILGKGATPDFQVTKRYTGDSPGEIKEGLLKEGKVLSIFDFDDTLVKSLSWIYIKKNGKEIKKLDAAEFAVYKLKAGEEFDFRDFDKKIQSPKLINKNVNLLKRQLSKHGRKVTILTARKLGLPVTSFLKTIGIVAYVVPLGTADPKKKADYIEKEIKKGYDTVYFMDDSPKNIRAVNALKKKYPKVKLVTKLVK